MAKFKLANQVRDVVEIMRQTDVTQHSVNRANIDQLFDGWPPFTDEEAATNHINTNVNFLEAPGLAHKARSTWNNAMLTPANRFSIGLDSGPLHKRGQWASVITRELNRPITRSRPYMESVRAQGATTILHGIGPKNWARSKMWCPHSLAIEDLLVPTATRVSLDNLAHFAIYRQYTPEELFRMTHGNKVDEGWNIGMVRRELKRLVEDEITAAPRDAYQDLVSPEKLTQFYKENSGFLDTDRVPTSNQWHFFYQENDGHWYTKAILDDTCQGEGFIYNPRRPYAGDLSEILAFQFADGANVAPFLYHTVRSLGFLLYATCHLQNRLRCRFMDAIFEATLQYFRVTGGDDRARVQKVDLFHLGVIPDGVNMVPAQERWQINENLVVAGLAQNRQLMSENASAFVQNVDQGTSKELTATEVMARLNNANALVSSLLSMAYTYASYEYREIARRFTLRDSPDPDVRKFRFACLKAGIPETFLNVERWDISPEKVMGGGNKTLQITQAKALQEIRPHLDPSAQRDVDRSYVLAVTDDADQAERLVPPQRQLVNAASHDAQLAVGTLMNGAPVSLQQGIDHVSYVDAFIASLTFVAQDIEHLAQQGEVPQGWQIIGLVNAYKHVEQHIALVAQDPAEKSRVKAWNGTLKEVMNKVREWSQQVDKAREERLQAANGGGAKNAALMLQAQTKAQIATSAHAGKEQRAQQKFAADQQRKTVQLTADQQRKNAQVGGEQQRKNAATAAELQRGRLQTLADIQALDAKTAADVKARRKKATIGGD